MTQVTRRPWGWVPGIQRPPGKPAPAIVPKLETRVCQCGCERKFSVLPGSPALYASARCVPQNGPEVVL